MKTTRWINRSAVALALLGALMGIGMVVLGRADSGIRLVVHGDRIVVGEVLPYSAAAGVQPARAVPVGQAQIDPSAGLSPGMIVTTLNERTIIRLPAYVYGSPEPTADPVTGEYPAPIPNGVEPAVPTLAVDAGQLPQLAAEPVRSLYAVAPGDLAAWTPDSAAGISFWTPWWLMTGGAFTWAAGLLALFLAAWWLASGRAGATLRGMAWPVATAAAAPLLLWPLEASGSPAGVTLFSILLPISMLPMAGGLIRRVETPGERVLALTGAAACAVGTAAVGLARLAGGPLAGTEQALVISALASGITLLPALAAADAERSRQTPDGTAERRVIAGSGLAAAGSTPFFAVQSAIGPFPMALPLWLAAVAIANRLTIRPLARLASRAQQQRDLVVAVTEAERARVAADIHDDALQELTMLVRRLDAAGDAEGAEIARGVSDRLRAICGDLRLPILDDLGVGPALDWLVLRMERIAGGPVRLERSEGPRPPADVELALFRVAQEALANAVKHGATPISVRYRQAEGSASLSVDDSGPGIDPGAVERATGEGRYGLTNMAQRAEAISAILDVRRWPGGGTHVQVEWRAK